MFPKKIQGAIALFFVGLLLAVGITACSTPSVKSAKVNTAAAAVLLPGAPDPAQALEDIMNRGEVRIAVPDDFPPFGSIGADMNVHGYDIDVASQVAQGMGVKLEIVPVIGNYRIPFLQTNRVDMVISSLGKNKDREKIISFSIPYAPFYSGIYGGEALAIKTYADLQGKTIGVAQGSLEDLELTKNLTEGNVQNVTIKRFANNSLTASAIVSGQVELIATGNVVANKLIRDNPDQRIKNQFVMKNSPCYVGFRKGDTDLQAKVNEILRNLRRDGKLDEFAKQWFGEPLGDLPTA
ncbi:MAG: transporter substrate-binding domain-containing protein [Oscillatoriophycideae cyanobacterium NC_groundwater_1537_Pr4_S-0.65um_50_18]|nr:transporter substrate-binding domain-containing protein [Oscillatoriophycideae cyanobacterium NC_groundwater_1537_Pr4_S-0.65um_50_18]